MRRFTIPSQLSQVLIMAKCVNFKTAIQQHFRCTHDDVKWKHCAGNSPVPGEFPTQRPVTRSFDVFFDLRLNKRLSKQWWSWWFETLSLPLWCHRNAPLLYLYHYARVMRMHFHWVLFYVADLWEPSRSGPRHMWATNCMPGWFLWYKRTQSD